MGHSNTEIDVVSWVWHANILPHFTQNNGNLRFGAWLGSLVAEKIQIETKKHNGVESYLPLSYFFNQKTAGQLFPCQVGEWRRVCHSQSRKRKWLLTSILLTLKTPFTGKPADSRADLGEGALTGGPRHLARRQADSAASRGNTHTYTHWKMHQTQSERGWMKANQRVAD